MVVCGNNVKLLKNGKYAIVSVDGVNRGAIPCINGEIVMNNDVIMTIQLRIMHLKYALPNEGYGFFFDRSVKYN